MEDMPIWCRIQTTYLLFSRTGMVFPFHLVLFPLMPSFELISCGAAAGFSMLEAARCHAIYILGASDPLTKYDMWQIRNLVAVERVVL